MHKSLSPRKRGFFPLCVSGGYPAPSGRMEPPACLPKPTSGSCNITSKESYSHPKYLAAPWPSSLFTPQPNGAMRAYNPSRWPTGHTCPQNAFFSNITPMMIANPKSIRR